MHELRHLGLVVLESADTLIELAHADVGRVGDLSGAVHHCLHGNGGRGIRLDGDSVFAAERLLEDLAHRGGDHVAVRADRGGSAHRIGLRCCALAGFIAERAKTATKATTNTEKT